MNTFKAESESELLYGWQFTANQFVLATSPLRLTTNNFIFQLNTCDYSPPVTFSLTRGWVCRLQWLLVLARAVILRSESRGTHEHILLSQIRGSPNLEGEVPVFISPQEQGGPIIPPGIEFPSAPFNSSAGRRLGTRLHWTKFCTATANFGTLPYNHFARTMQKTKRLHCWEGVFTAPLYSKGRYSIVACVFVAEGMFLPNRCLAITAHSNFAIPTFGRHVTISCLHYYYLVSYYFLM
jgi:hypothetical protein